MQRCLALVVLLTLIGALPLSAQTIYVPKPKGEGETLDTEPKAAPDAGLDEVRFGKGSVVVGRVLRVTPDSVLAVASPDLKGDLQIQGSAARTVKFGAVPKAEKPARTDCVVLANKDVLAGEILSITPEAVVLREPAVGTLTLARRVVTSLSFGSDVFTLLDTNFTDGAGPWKGRQGNWAVQNGRFACTSGGTSIAAAEVELKDSFTCEWSVQSQQGGYLQSGFLVMASNDREWWGRDALAVQISGNDIQAYAVRGGGVNHIGQYSHNQMIAQANLRLQHNAEKKQLQVWLNGNSIGTWGTGTAPQSGRYVLLTTQMPCSFGPVKITRGAAGGPAEAEADKDQDRITLQNKDRVSGKIVSLADGKLKVTTPYGTMDIVAANAGEVVFAKTGQETPRRRARDVLVEFNNSRLTLELKQMNEASLEGGTEFAGPVTIQRNALRALKFNLYE